MIPGDGVLMQRQISGEGVRNGDADSNLVRCHGGTVDKDLCSRILQLEQGFEEGSVDFLRWLESRAIAPLDQEEYHGGMSVFHNIRQSQQRISGPTAPVIRVQSNAVLHPGDWVDVHETILFHAMEDEIDLAAGAICPLAVNIMVLGKRRDCPFLQSFVHNFACDGSVDAHPRAIHLDEFPGEAVPPGAVPAVRQNDPVARLVASQHRSDVGAMGCNGRSVLQLHVDERSAVALDENTGYERCREFHRIAGATFVA